MGKKHRAEGTALRVGVPPFRSRRDISIPEDILEEVLRIYGFDNIPPVLPAVPITPLHVEKHLKLEHKIRRGLATAHRFLEVHNYIWFNDNWLQTLDYEPEETSVLKNPTSPETSRLRTTLIPNLLALVPKNRPFRESFRLFEIGRVFYPLFDKENNEDGCSEWTNCGGAAFQRAGSLEDLYFSVKSAIEDVLKACGVQCVAFKEPVEEPEYIWQSPGYFVNVVAVTKEVNPNSHDGYTTTSTTLGSLGILGKNMTARVCREGGQVVWFEIDLDMLVNYTTLDATVKFEEPPRYPLSWQDFSLLWKIDKGFDRLESLLDHFVDPLVNRREFLTSYQGKGLDKDTACYSFRFWIGSPEHTLSGEEIETFHQRFLAYIKENGIALRT